jgi:hypothetical protein
VEQLMQPRHRVRGGLATVTFTLVTAFGCGPSDDTTESDGSAATDGGHLDSSRDVVGDISQQTALDGPNESQSSQADVAVDQGPDLGVADVSPDSSEAGLTDTPSMQEGPIDGPSESQAEVGSDAGADGDSGDVSADSADGGSGDGSAMPGVACTCSAGTKRCGDKCVSIDDPAYGCTPVGCLPCWDVPEMTCSMGACKATKCRDGWADCDGYPGNGCEADLNRPATCGSCGTSCPKCSNRTCVASCDPPLTDCSGECADLLRSPTHCGNCATSCPLGTCSNGTCSSTVTCGANLTSCGGYCADTQSAVNDCGSCGHQCVAPTNGIASCRQGQCVESCGPGLELCGDACVSLYYDDAHCGACDVDCGSTAVCQAGKCVPAATIQLATGLGTPTGITLDAQYVYWTDTTNNTVMRVAKTGGAPQLIAGSQYKPMHVVVDDTNAYWTNFLGRAVMKAPKDGGGVPTMVTTAENPNEIVRDDQSLYFTFEGGGSTNVGVASVAPSGGVAVVIMPTYFQFAPRGLTLDANYVYVAMYRGVGRVPKAGGQVAAFGTSVSPAGPNGIAVDDTFVYSSDADADGRLSPFQGTYRNLKTMAYSPRIFLTDLQRAPVRLDGEFIFENLSKVARCGGPTITVRPGTANDTALDSERIYWTAPGFVGAALK